MNLLNGLGFRNLERTLDVSALRQKVTANNIANVDTPNFKRSDVKFEELLQNEMNGPVLTGKRTDARHIPIGSQSLTETKPEIIEDDSSSMNNNLNNVDIDSEMSSMAKNQLRYETILEQVNHQIRDMRTAVRGGR